VLRSIETVGEGGVLKAPICVDGTCYL